VDVFQQHAAMMGGAPNGATSCPICHKLFLGGETLIEHMKHAHKDPNTALVPSQYLSLYSTLYLYCIILLTRVGQILKEIGQLKLP
jgi:hypothetical protein